MSQMCPRCFASIDSSTECPGCGLRFVRDGGLLDVLGGETREVRAAAVERFYAENPFPGYAMSDDAGSILDRSRHSGFLRALDEAIGPAARVLDCGCGTGQLAAFLALAGPRRAVFGIDGCRVSLEHAESFRARAGIDNLQLVRADLFDLPVADRSFDIVVCRGVVHHTPDPYTAIRSVARCVAPDGVLVLGIYETRARLAHRVRRGLSRVLGQPLRILDPVLRRSDLDPEKKRIWIEDQYRHPEEHILPLQEVVRVLDELDFEWCRTVPPMPVAESLLAPTPRPGTLAVATRRAGWALRGWNDPDAGLVCYISRRRR